MKISIFSAIVFYFSYIFTSVNVMAMSCSELLEDIYLPYEVEAYERKELAPGHIHDKMFHRQHDRTLVLTHVRGSAANTLYNHVVSVATTSLKSESRVITTNTAVESDSPILMKDILGFAYYTKLDWESFIFKHRGKIRLYDTDWSGENLLKEQLLLLEDLRPDEQKIALKIKRETSRGSKHYKKAQELEGHLDIIGVEYAILKIKLKSGDIHYAEHTSNRQSSINFQDIVSALSGVGKKKSFLPDDIEELHFFHNHPGIAQPISKPDVGVAKQFIKILGDTNHEFSFHMYAISFKNELRPTLIFHAGFQF